MKEKIFNGKFEKLRSEKRLKMIEVDRVVSLALEGISVKSALDIGTGSGVFAEAFAKFVETISGIDLNPDVLELAKEFVPQGKFRVAFAEDLPFEDNEFDLVFFGHVLHESSERLKSLSEAKRCATKRVVVLEWPIKDKEGHVSTGRRVDPEEMKNYVEVLGFKKYKKFELENMILYRMDI